MSNKADKPTVQKYSDNEWEFAYPSSMNTEDVDELFWSAVELLGYDDAKAEMIFKTLVITHPYHIDAYNHLSIAFDNQGKVFESLLTAEKSFELGKSCLPKSFNFKSDRLSWYCMDNRPFLRACQISGLKCQGREKYQEAVDVYTMLLLLNKDDNQGIRYLLLEIYFAIKDYVQVRLLLDKYPDDFSIEFTFGLVALNIIEGNYEEADNNLKKAVKTNKFFVREVIRDKPLRARSSKTDDSGYAVGSAEQAFEYWKRNKQLYQTKKIIEYFKQVSG